MVSDNSKYIINKALQDNYSITLNSLNGNALQEQFYVINLIAKLKKEQRLLRYNPSNTNNYKMKSNSKVILEAQRYLALLNKPLE